MDESLYEGREQSLVKHLILKRYLIRFALITGRNWSSITYVDCFSGPWESQSQSHDDTSFAIAIQQLREARSELANAGVDLQLRAFFIEEKPAAFARLQAYVNQITDVEVEVRNSPLEASIPDICDFVQRASRCLKTPSVSRG